MEVAGLTEMCSKQNPSADSIVVVAPLQLRVLLISSNRTGHPSRTAVCTEGGLNVHVRTTLEIPVSVDKRIPDTGLNAWSITAITR